MLFPALKRERKQEDVDNSNRYSGGNSRSHI
jgi:hypothetical protein